MIVKVVTKYEANGEALGRWEHGCKIEGMVGTLLRKEGVSGKEEHSKRLPSWFINSSCMKD